MTEIEHLRSAARSRYGAGDLRGALEVLRSLVEAAPDDAEALNDMGAVLFALGSRSESVRCFARAVALDPGSSEAQQNLRSACQATGMAPDAALRGGPGPAGSEARAGRSAGGRPPDVSVVIPYGGGDPERCLAALRGQAFPQGEFEVIVVANGLSTDDAMGLEDALGRWRPQLGGRLVCASLDRASIPMARNEGVRRSRGRVIVQIDHDVVLAPDALAGHFRAHESQAFAPDRVVIGGSRFAPCCRRNLMNFLSEAIWLGTPLHERIPPFRADHTWCSTRNMSFVRKAYDLFGGFDPRLALCSDLGLGKRWAAEHGVHFHVDTGIGSQHLRPMSFAGWREDCIRRIPHTCRVQTGLLPEELGGAQRRQLQAQLDEMSLDPERVAGEFERLDGLFTGPDDFAGLAAESRLCHDLTTFVRVLQPLLLDYRRLIQLRELIRLHDAGSAGGTSGLHHAPAGGMSVAAEGGEDSPRMDLSARGVMREAVAAQRDPKVKGRVHLVYFTCRQHYLYLYASLRSLELIASPYVGTVNVYIDANNPLTGEQTHALLRNLTLDLSISATKHGMAWGGPDVIDNELTAFRETAHRAGPDDYVAKVDSDVVFISDEILRFVLASDFDLIGYPNLRGPFRYTQGGCYLLKAPFVARLQGPDVAEATAKAARRTDYELSKCPEDAAIYLLARRHTDKLKFRRFYLPLDRRTRITDADRRRFSIIHFERCRDEMLSLLGLEDAAGTRSGAQAAEPARAGA